MPIPADVIKFEIRGTEPGAEIWQTGFWAAAGGTVGSSSDLAGKLDTVKDYILTWWTAIKSTVYNTCSYTEARAYWYPGGGTTAQYNATYIPTAQPGTKSTAGSPIDTALCCTIRTPQTGLSRRGRMYVPYHSTNQLSGLWQTSEVTTVVNATAAMLSSVNGVAGLDVVVVSRALGDLVKANVVSADLRPDVQRRRVNRLSAGTPVGATITP